MFEIIGFVVCVFVALIFWRFIAAVGLLVIVVAGAVWLEHNVHTLADVLFMWPFLLSLVVMAGAAYSDYRYKRNNSK